MKEIITSRMKVLALGVIDVVQALPRGDVGTVLGKQLLRSATGIGANYRSACKAKSQADFIAKIAIAEEEADETQYWLELLVESKLISGGEFSALYNEARELTAILASSGKTAKHNLNSVRVSGRP
jgi:four helix bundle protein